MKNFPQIMGLLFGSVGAHTYQKLSKSPSPHLGLQNFPTQTSNIFATLFHGILVFFQEFLLFWDQVLEIAKVSNGDKRTEDDAPLPIVEERHHRFNLSIQSFCPVAFTYHILQFCLFRKDSFHLTGYRYFWNFSHLPPLRAY